MGGLGLQQAFSLSQTLSPQMQQSLHLLQAPVLELSSLVQQEMQTNPVLEEGVAGEAQKEEWEGDAELTPREDESWRDYFSQSWSRGAASGEEEKKRQFLFDSQVKPESLADHLMGQLIFAVQKEEELKVGEEIIGNLDEAGFLQTPLEEISKSARVPLGTAQRVLELVQTFHPIGVGARDLRETLLIQLKHRGKEADLESRIVEETLEELGRKRYAELARRFSVSLERVQEAAAYIARLQPKPGAAFAPSQPQNIVQPEAALIKDGEEWVVQMNSDPLPKLRISDGYKDLLGQADRDAMLRGYLQEKIRSGKFLIKCLRQRQDTIEKILKEIVARQRDFLEKGTSQMKPLTMNQVAQAVGVHETTVSRAVAGKYVQTPQGVLPMKFFFTHGYQTTQGAAVANTGVKKLVGELIAREEGAHPFSDTEIAQILVERGIPIARRTVAKYRTELKILPSNLRRK
ncbi:MAG: RNA polymerase factor sigma-54 [bacterium]